MTDLVTRLRSTRMVDKGDRATLMVEVLRNIDGPEAADRIETLEAEITRLQRELGNQPRVRMCEPKDE